MSKKRERESHLDRTRLQARAEELLQLIAPLDFAQHRHV
eukprot:COSAG03_NODE_2954_length_2329_cov_11.453363_1_plen_38_part_10